MQDQSCLHYSFLVLLLDGRAELQDGLMIDFLVKEMRISLEELQDWLLASKLLPV